MESSTKLKDRLVTLVLFIVLIPAHFIPVAFLVVTENQAILGRLLSITKNIPIHTEGIVTVPALFVTTTTLLVVVLSISPFGKQSYFVRRLRTAHLAYFIVFGVISLLLFPVGYVLWGFPLFILQLLTIGFVP